MRAPRLRMDQKTMISKFEGRDGVAGGISKQRKKFDRICGRK
jgi:hypothetical protein